MAVNIGELQVQTQAPAAAPAAGGGKAGLARQPQPNLKAALDKQRERDLRLRAD